MATTEHNGLLTYVDAAGDKHLLYPITRADLVDGLEELLGAKAPAGYGLGGDTRFIASGDTLASYISTGFYSWGSGVSDAPFDAGSMIVIKRSDGFLYQIAFQDDAYIAAVSIRKFSETAWSEWEYVNPRMVPGVEYRTTERYMGKAVYTKLLDCGALANAKTVSFGPGTLLRGIAYVSGRGCMPFDFGAGSSANCNAVFDNDIYFYSGGAYDGYQVYAQIWITKD